MFGVSWANKARLSHVYISCQKEPSQLQICCISLLGRSHARSKQEGGLWKVYHILWECAKKKDTPAPEGLPKRSQQLRQDMVQLH